MSNEDSKKLLQDARVRAEINKHKWIESEKAGYDIGFDKAAEDWISHYADDWEESQTKKENRKLRKPKLKGKNLPEGDIY